MEARAIAGMSVKGINNSDTVINDHLTLTV